MGDIKKLMGKSKEFTINGEQFTFKPLIVDNIDLIMDLENETKRAGAMKKIIKMTLKDACPTALEEDISKVAIGHFQELTKAILEVNGLNEIQRENKQIIS